jgi:hypothetical protein
VATDVATDDSTDGAVMVTSHVPVKKKGSRKR